MRKRRTIINVELDKVERAAVVLGTQGPAYDFSPLAGGGSGGSSIPIS
jgi:hypothetical protein